MAVGIEIITPRGTFLEAGGFEQVVMRRREERFELGSEIVVRPRHGRMLVRLPMHVMRLEHEGEVRRIEVDGGFAEVRDDVVSVLTTGARELTGEQVGCPR